jgi:hypothetical protein
VEADIQILDSGANRGREGISSGSRLFQVYQRDARVSLEQISISSHTILDNPQIQFPLPLKFYDPYDGQDRTSW